MGSSREELPRLIFGEGAETGPGAPEALPRLIFGEGAEPGPGAPEASRAPEARPAPVSEGDRAMVDVFAQAHRLLMTHPIAAQALFRAFVAEGRRFAQTEEGAALKAELAGSELIRKGRVVWEGNSFNMLEEDSPSAPLLPSALLDAMVAATAHDDLDLLLDRFANPWSRPDDGTNDPST